MFGLSLVKLTGDVRFKYTVRGECKFTWRVLRSVFGLYSQCLWLDLEAINLIKVCLDIIHVLLLLV